MYHSERIPCKLLIDLLEIWIIIIKSEASTRIIIIKSVASNLGLLCSLLVEHYNLIMVGKGVKAKGAFISRWKWLSAYNIQNMVFCLNLLLVLQSVTDFHDRWWTFATYDQLYNRWLFHDRRSTLRSVGDGLFIVFYFHEVVTAPVPSVQQASQLRTSGYVMAIL